ncbi:MAG: aldehyde dehydrogenase [Anaplasmataceae bacterium]|nr:aldehyde dehydrogenase [Anaplasmataceae bacterium]
MASRIALNGFGRIGRHFLRQSFGRSDFQVVAVNDLGDLENLAYLLKYDTVYGRYDKDISINKEAGELVVQGQVIKALQIKDPTQLPWGEMQIDLVIEATGLFESFEKAKVHLDAGAKRVVITAPAKDEDGDLGKTILMGINQNQLETVRMSSNGSCTTNSASPVVQVLSETIGIEKAMLSTVHGYTATQNLVDGPVKGGHDFRRGRGAAQNISPSTTGAAIAVTRAISELKGKFDGLAFRVPVPAGSLSDITFLAKRNTSVEEINSILKEAASSPRWQGILKVTEDQLVSSDILGESYGAIVDLSLTKVVDGNLVKVLSWYDNEFGYVSTLVKHVEVAATMI